MKVCVVGAGALGGMLAAKFAQAGQEVSLVDRGLHLDAIKEGGLRLVMADGTQSLTKDIQVSGSIGDLGPADIVILGIKAHQMAAVAPQLPLLYKSDTVVLTVQNGIPWWYFQRYDNTFGNTRLKTLDPDGVISAHIPPERILGSVAYPACELLEPGVIHHVEGKRFAFGELDGRITERANSISELFNSSGFKSYVIDDIRNEIWLKAWGALAFNPISALTQATMVEICHFPETRKLAECMMQEAQEIATKLGISFRVPIEKRIAGAESVGAHKTSMLQDIQAGRAIEIEAVVGSIRELASLTNTACPAVDAVYACTSLLNKIVQKR